jgi:two-component system OmpR family sensor kinase
LVLVAVVAVGLVVSDLVVYVQLRSFLLARVDSQLQDASFAATGILLRDHTLPVGPATGRPAGASPSSTTSTTSTTSGNGSAGTTGTGTAKGGPTFPTGPFPFAGRHKGAGSHGGEFPEGTIGELVGRDGKVVGAPVSFVYGGTAPPGPALPYPLPEGGSAGAVFSAGSLHGGTVAYRVLARPLHSSGLTLVVAIPLTETNQTLGRLALVMVLVSLAVLAGLGALAWWIVRRGLRPLEEMAVTAGAIAAGDLSRRVAPAEERTEVGRLGIALNAMLGEIETAFAARAASEGRLRRFLADASHELRTPLTSIRGYAEIFDMGARDRPEDLATAMHHIREEADRMKVLVDDLLLLARLDRQRPLEMAPTDLVPLVSRAAAAGRASAPGGQIVLEVPAEAIVAGDAHRLRQVVDNLVNNALRHSPEGRAVEVRLSADPIVVVLEVGDHGAGVPAEDRDRIFEPFYRADTSRARSTGGAGLGLAIVAAIARAHGGTVGIEANRGITGPATVEGDGARFWVRLPAYRDPDRSDPGPGDPADPAAGTTGSPG